MRIIIISSKSGFLPQQIEAMKNTAKVIFVVEKPDFKSSYFNDQEEKVIALGPEQLDWKFPQEVWEKIPNLKAVCVPTTGFDWVDGRAMKKAGIVLTNVPKYSTESVAEYAISLMFNVSKKLPLVLKNNWKIDYSKHQGWEIKGKIMGVIGLGSIGARIAELGQQMGMKVIYWSREARDSRFKYHSLNEVLRKADYIFPALARNKETKGLLDKSKLNQMKKDSFIVSITGDDIFDLQYAIQLVHKGRLAGIALESEKETVQNYEGNIWITPPIAWFTKEAFAEDIKIWTKHSLLVQKEKQLIK
ncbi:hypothetical protein GYA49_00775 [Candidatus Beckwithbacteria bacterium]|nr:hypothetical protein [Candidatus Beckwithbacteria bacterium]